ncbi:MAG: glycosyltransferase family 4 protein, partial [Nanoarchaeota archaeon]
CDLVLLPSHGVANLFKWYKITPKQAIAPLGVNTKKFVPPESKIEAKKKLGINPNATVVGYVGRLAYEKDLKTLVRAYQRQRDLHEDLQLLLVGSGVDDLRLKLEKIRGVVIAGNQNDVVPYYQAMDIYVLPSLTETTSLSTLEAMSCEVPVITTPVGEASKYVKNGKNGYKFSKGNSFELSHFMKLLIEDEKMRNKLGMHARRTVEENYSWDAAAKHIMGILQSVLV